ncbi:MAG: Chromosomal replication initiator, DnaA C-terminal domain [Bryobacterales bacterium]|nr:Chromosomal replication initiator, DnaA C-terminal domain [Bryobacterales bacterium]
MWPVTLRHIETIVSTWAGRVPGNRQSECFSRQVSMYLAKHVGGWSTPQIGRFYNGRHHTTVLYAIRKTERLREADECIAALVDELIGALTPGGGYTRPEPRNSTARASAMDAVASLMIERLTSSSKDRRRSRRAEPAWLSMFNLLVRSYRCRKRVDVPACRPLAPAFTGAKFEAVFKIRTRNSRIVRLLSLIRDRLEPLCCPTGFGRFETESRGNSEFMKFTLHLDIPATGANRFGRCRLGADYMLGTGSEQTRNPSACSTDHLVRMLH